MTEQKQTGRPPNDGERASAWIQLRTTRARKGAYVRAARPGKLTDWVFGHLDKAAGYKGEGKLIGMDAWFQAQEADSAPERGGKGAITPRARSMMLRTL